MNVFGETLKRLRDEQNLSQESLGSLLKCSGPTISRLESGLRVPNLEEVERAERALGADGRLMALVPHLLQRQSDSATPLGYPPVPRRLVGRADLSERLAARLAEPWPGTMVLSGFGGIGKSALTAAVCAEVRDMYPDGCVRIDFRGHATDEPELTPDQALERLLCQITDPQGIPADRDSRTTLLWTRLARRRMLLIFENVRTAAQVRHLLPGRSPSAVIITSRNRLASLDGAENVHVKPLARDAARDLFGVISQVTADEEDCLAEILDRCGGLPLAIQAVAARHRTGCWSLAELRTFLESPSTRFLTLDDDENRVTSALSVSVDLLRPAERELLTLLSLHPSGRVDPHNAAALTDLPRAEAETLISGLVDSHLLDRHPGGAVELHDLLRTLLVDRRVPDLAEETRDRAVTRLIEHTACTLARANALMEPRRYLPALPPVATDFTDAGGALTWLRSNWPAAMALCEIAAGSGKDHQCVSLANLLRGFFSRDKLIEPWIRTHRCALEAARRTGDPKACATTLNNLGMALLEFGDHTEAARCHHQAIALFTEAGDNHGATDARCSLAWVWVYQDRSERALEQLRVAAAQYEADRRQRNHMITLRGMALAAARLDLHAEATAYAEQAVGMAETPQDEILGVNMLGWAHFRAGHHREAEDCYFRASSLSELEHEYAERSRALVGLSNVASALGKQDEAERWWSAANDQRVVLNASVVPELAHRQAVLGQARPAWAGEPVGS
ncbi:helix-turn-helix domain-containing protein [Actinokineospora spheciospongiae]|uniref:helix-turn-helix domain-containing protein n=1 Tax=Actinokineospora spheciospongiae TaxID=909613 RepID=UPI000D711E30|nr:helix-turn-helix domain-containing protein [Actinokineospora spheciospongiae]PWW58354.1 tetratricopeptide repeat protein [Actinokineospora spheciospongiae]